MSQPSGFPQPIDALLAVATCLGDFTIKDETGTTDLSPQFVIGDEGVGAVIDCCSDGRPVLRIESGGEAPADGLPSTPKKHGCFGLVMNITVTFMTCFKTITKSGAVVRDVEGLEYSKTILDARWRAIKAFRCCDSGAIKYVASTPKSTDGKCSGFEIKLLANLSMCGPCESSDSASS